MSLEGNQVFYTFQGQALDDNMADGDDDIKVSKDEALIKFIKFIREWKYDSKYIYR